MIEILGDSEKRGMYEVASSLPPSLVVKLTFFSSTMKDIFCNIYSVFAFYVSFESMMPITCNGSARNWH